MICAHAAVANTPKGQMMISKLPVCIVDTTTTKWNFFYRLPFFLRCFTLMLIVVALARPQAGRSQAKQRSEGIDIMLVADASGSMNALDFVIDGKRQIQDGPFPDTKEQLAGFFLIDVPDLDKALEWAARCPSTTRGGIVEIRPALEQPT